MITEVEQEEIPKQKKSKKIQYEQSELQHMMLISALTYVYREYEVKVGKTKSNLVSYMVKDQLKYSAKHAKFAMHFAESVDKLAAIKSIDKVF